MIENAERSIWRATSPRIEADAELPAESDVVVAGAGLAGAAAALMLSSRGHRVVLLDAAAVGARTTGDSTAKLSLLQGRTLSTLLERPGPAALRAYAEANSHAQVWLRDRLHGTGAEERRTAYTYATGVEGDEAVRREAEACVLAGLDVRVHGRGDIGLPFPVSSSLELEDQSQLHPMAVLAQLVRDARRHGTVVVEHCRLRAVHDEAEGLVVETARGRVRARRLILATGFPALDRDAFFARLTPSRQFVGAYRLPAGMAAPDGIYLSVDRISRSLRTARGEGGETLLVVGGNSYFPGRDPDTSQRLDALDRWTSIAFPGAVRTHWWAAQDYRMANGRPFMGPISGHDGRVLAAMGFAKWGMTNAVAAAIALAGHAEGSPPEWAAPFADRAVGRRGAGEMLKSNAEVAGRVVTGWTRPQESYRDADGSARARVIRRGVLSVAESVVDGTHCAVSAVCTHLGGVLRWNSAERSWDCPLHGSRFAPDGRVLEGPAKHDLKPKGGAS
ncbi:FAD-dependent oxidoreductase [Microbacterium sp. SD291]|uniref:FAD-dependent oxidoreductase n=1 Tax=Microbacterium sp. SD291 TaxID=2782007 RepID=UPI001A973D9E|nr:FAD-dependent oxidoreductase [Microbacterium sp. SD291]MBO0981247.1 FAD-dependent oxidoreductase [Microbacterium sp. SD291]